MRRKITAFTICLTLILCVNISANAAAKVASLMYHNVTDNQFALDDWTVSPEQLDADIQYFMDCGYITMTATELVRSNISDIDGKKILLLTFDDGYASFYTKIYPILKKHNAKATMFLISSYVDRYGYLNSDQTYEMANSGLVEIGNHTNAIHGMPKPQLQLLYLNQDAFGDILGDIDMCGKELERIIGKPVTSISWPYGFYTTTLDSAVKERLGYEISFSTDYGVNFYTGNAYNPLKRMNRESNASTQTVFDRANGKF